MSICPKNKSSRSHRVVKCSKCGALTMPHRVCRNCGSYNKKTVIEVED